MTSSFAQWLYDWQTLVAGLLAVAAAFISVFFLRRQIDQAERHERTRLARRSAAARSALPLTLSGIADYADETAASLISFYEDLKGDRASDDRKPHVRHAPVDVVSALERVIETTESPAISGRIADLVSRIQLLDAKLRDANRRHSAIAKIQIESLVIEAAVVRAYANSLFEYARRDSETVEGDITWVEVMDSLKGMLWEHELPAIWQLAQDRQQRGWTIGG